MKTQKTIRCIRRVVKLVITIACVIFTMSKKFRIMVVTMLPLEIIRVLPVTTWKPPRKVKHTDA